MNEMLVTRAQAAEHLRIDNVAAEATTLDLLIQAASGVVLDYLEMSVSDFTENAGDSDAEFSSDDLDEVPSKIKAAVLLLVGDMYRYRDSGAPTYTEAILPPAVRALLYPLKTWGITSDDLD